MVKFFSKENPGSKFRKQASKISLISSMERLKNIRTKHTDLS